MESAKQLIKLADNTRRPWTMHYCPGEKLLRSDGIFGWNVKPVCHEVRKLPDLRVLMPFDDRPAVLNDSTRIPVPTHKKVAHQHDLLHYWLAFSIKPSPTIPRSCYIPTSIHPGSLPTPLFPLGPSISYVRKIWII